MLMSGTHAFLLGHALRYGGPFVHLLSHALIARTATLIGLPHFARTVAL